MPLNDNIGRPALASMRVKLASTLHVAPCCNVIIALFVASSDVKTNIDPVREVKAFNAVVMVYVTPSLNV